MKIEDLPTYLDLRSKMQSIPDQLKAAVGDATRVCCHLYLPTCPDGFHRVQISEASWSKLIAANDGKLPKEIAEWDQWDRLESAGCCRFFWRGNPNALDAIKTILEQGDSILIEYEKIPRVAEELQWKLPGLMHFSEDKPDYRTLLEIICEWTEDITYEGEGEGVQLEEAGMEILFDQDDPFDGPPSRLKKVGLVILCVDDLVSAVQEAVDKWIVPYDRDLAEFQIMKSQPKAKAAQPPVESITINKGHAGFQLNAKGRMPVAIGGPKFPRLFVAFVLRALHKAAGEVVPWEDLHKSLKITDADATPTSGGKTLRKQIDSLNDLIAAEFGKPTKDKDWILSKRKNGPYLNPCCKWQVGKELWRELGGRTDPWLTTGCENIGNIEDEKIEDENEDKDERDDNEEY